MQLSSDSPVIRELLNPEVAGRQFLKRAIQSNARKMAAVCCLCWALGTCVFVVVERLHTDITQKTSVSLPYHSHFIALEVAGGATYVTGFAGYWGALYQERDLVVVFKFIVLVSSIIELPVGATILTFSGKAVKQDTMTFVNSSVKEEEDFIFSIQRQLECCGSKSPADWVGSAWWEKERANQSSRVVPHSCCKDDDRRQRKCQEGPPPYKQVHTSRLIFTKGCHAKVVERRRHLLQSSGSIFCFCGVGKLASFFAIHYFTNTIIAKQQNLDELRSRNPSSVTSQEMETIERNYENRLKSFKEA
ncbi:hypothetical protein JTE90_006888 [Oedothorax gibbosus]|uniref:Tetraspanin n=1 Tax=Oedothorax gibbosus TaxID=931172 RepID=A0AAV6VN70_9ARAC|nr:hypothetical protein JTE90_006888 [Oedothorax gibbosus]